MKIIESILTGMILLAVTGCASMEVHSDWDTKADFSGLKTYDWVSGHQPQTGDARLDSGLLNERLRSAIDNELAVKGYQKSAGGSPDFWVSYHTSIDEKMDVTTFSTPYHTPYVGAGAYSHGGWYSDAWMNYNTQTFVTQYEQGTVLLDIADARTKNLIWRGSVSAVVDPEASPEKREKRINEAVSKVLKNFPPQLS